MRQWRTEAVRPWITIAVLGVLVLTAGCAGGTANTHQTVASTRASPGKTDKTPKVSLEIVVYGTSGAIVSRSTLRCGPAGGAHVRPAASCRTLRDIGDPFMRRARRTPCPQTYVGPRTARVVGSWFGTKGNQAG